MGGPRPRAVRSGREHAELRVRQAVLSRRRSGRDPAPESYRGAGAPHHRIGLSNSRAALARVPRRRRCRAASHPRHGVHGSERLCQRDPRPAARRKDERSSDPSLRHHSASSGGSGYPSRAHASGSRRMGASLNGTDPSRGSIRTRDDVHRCHRRRGPSRAYELSNAEAPRPFLQARSARHYDMGISSTTLSAPMAASSNVCWL